MRIRKFIDKDGVKAAVAVNVNEPGSVTAASSAQHAADEVAEQVEDESGRELPDREAMSLVNANVAIPINAAVAANVLSDDAVAYAEATQDAAIDQSN